MIAEQFRYIFLLENLKILSLGRNYIKNLNGLVSKETEQ